MNVFEGEQLIAYWGKGLDKFIIECLTKKKSLAYNKYIDIYYKGYVFLGVFFYVYATDARIICGEIVLKLVFLSLNVFLQHFMLIQKVVILHFHMDTILVMYVIHLCVS